MFSTAGGTMAEGFKTNGMLNGPAQKYIPIHDAVLSEAGKGF